MKTLLSYKHALLVLLTTVACGPENKEVTDEQIETGSRTEVLDTIANTRKDAVATDENNTNPTLPLPQQAIAVLGNKYPGWQQPSLSEEAVQATEDTPQSPTLIRGNFNNDDLEDYALQLQQGKDVVMVAILQDTTSNWKTYELKRDILFNERGKLISLYALELVEKGTEVQDHTTGKKIKIPHDAIAIHINEETATHVFSNGKFRSYGTAPL